MRTVRLLQLGTMTLALGTLPALAEPREEVPVVHAAAGGDLEARVARMENLVQSNGLLDLLSQVEKLQEEVRQLRGQVETQSHQMDELDRRLRALDHGGALSATAAAPINPPLPAIAPNAAPPTPSPGGNQAPNPAVQNAAPVSTANKPGSDNIAAPNTAPPPPGQGSGNPAPNPAVQNTAPANTAGNPAGGTAVAALAPNTAASPNAAANASGNPDQDYKQALDLLKRNRYDDAIAVLNNFLVTYPTHPNAESAEYWLGEAYYVSKQYPAAVSEFQKFAQAYPKSTKLSQVLLKTGFSYHEMGQVDQARATLENVKQRFPGTTAANMADQRLQRMRMEQKP